MRAFEESLARLDAERIDILHIHDPDDHYDAAIEGAYKALDGLRAQGVKNCPRPMIGNRSREFRTPQPSEISQETAASLASA